MGIMGASNIIGQAEQQFAIYDPYAAQGKSELGKEDFLTLLVAQLSHQDPLNPMDDKEFTSQLAEFSSLEQLTEISAGIDKMNTTDTQEQMYNAVSFIGKQIRAQGEGITKSGESMSTLYFELDETIANCYINIFDASGNMVRTEQTGAKQPGTYEYQWDGLDYNGNEMADGVYYVYMAAENSQDEAVMIYTDISGEVSGVQTVDDTHYLRLKDGRMVDMMSIKEVVDPQQQADSADTTEETEETTE